MNNITDEEIEKLNKLLMHAYNELCKAEKLLKKGSDKDGRNETIQNSRRDASSNR